jgi:hypothetical protein
MGYDTLFGGHFTLDRSLAQDQINYLQKFNDTRRMKRNNDYLINKPDPLREKVGLPLGIEGEFFVNGEGFMGQNRDDSVIDGNKPSSTQPGLWCQWRVSENGKIIEWDEGEKFYHYIEWIVYMVKNFIVPWGYVLNGEVSFQGECPDDAGKIIIEDNNIYLQSFDTNVHFKIIDQKERKQIYRTKVKL